MRFLFALGFALAACSSDPAPPVDSGMHVDQQPDTGWPWADAGEDRPTAMDAGVDTGPLDAGSDVDAWMVEEDPAPDTGPDVPRADAGPDADAAADAGSDVPADVRINCAVPGAPDLPCRSHADCAQCIPGAFGEPWCCRANGSCGVVVGASVCPPPACSASTPCVTGQTCCDGVCRDLQTDSMTCGSCNARCAGRVCRAGVCVVADAGSDAARD